MDSSTDSATRSTDRTALRNVAVVLAGGVGTRVGLDIPKQLIKIAGKPIIEHTLAALRRRTRTSTRSS